MELEFHDYKETFDLAEDVLRLDPWQGMPNHQLLFFEFEEDRNRYITVVFEQTDKTKTIRLLLGEEGLRAYYHSQYGRGSEAYVARFSQNAYVLYYNHWLATELEEEISQALRIPLGIRQLAPGKAESTVQALGDLNLIARVLRNLRWLLTNLSEISPSSVQKNGLFTGPLWLLGAKTPIDALTVTRQIFKASYQNEPFLDEFTLARLARLPIVDENVELFGFYYPKVKSENPLSYPYVVVLVNLNQSLIAWASDMDNDDKKGQEQLLRRLVDFIVKEGYRPKYIQISDANLYGLFGADFAAAGMMPIKIDYSHIGNDVLEAYLQPDESDAETDDQPTLKSPV